MTTYQGRRAAAIENEHLRVTVLEEGGHLAAILDRETGINPLWTPPWRSIEPSAFDAEKHAAYGAGAEAKLLAGIMGQRFERSRTMRPPQGGRRRGAFHP